jgi:predicted RNA binding protein YcfA (HicA-like mRNA interferase family)
MPKIPILSDREIIALIGNKGFVFVRQKGSHKIFRKNGQNIIVPCHNKQLKRGLIAKIFKDADIKFN